VKPDETVSRFTATNSCSATRCVLSLAGQAAGDGSDPFLRFAASTPLAVRDAVLLLIANPGLAPELFRVLWGTPEPNCVYAAASSKRTRLTGAMSDVITEHVQGADPDEIRQLASEQCWDHDVRRLSFDWGQGLDSCILHDWTRALEMLAAGEAVLVSLLSACPLTSTCVKTTHEQQQAFDQEQVGRDLATHALSTRVAILEATGMDRDVAAMLWQDVNRYTQYCCSMLRDGTDCEGAPLARKTWFEIQVAGEADTCVYPHADVSPRPEGFAELAEASQRQLLGGRGGEVDEVAARLCRQHATLEVLRHCT